METLDVMLADFGLSKILCDDYANLSSNYGCRNFISPEIKKHIEDKGERDL